MAHRTVIPIPDEEPEVDVLGSGDPIVIFHTALAADELRPLAGLRAATPSYLQEGTPTSQGRNETGTRRADLVAAGGQNSQQPAGTHMAASGQNHVAADSPECARRLLNKAGC